MQDRRTFFCLPAVLLSLGFVGSRAQSSNQDSLEARSSPASSSTLPLTAGTNPAGRPPESAPTRASTQTPPPSARPLSLFDAIQPVTATVEVRASVAPLETSSPAPITAGGQDVINSAGTFGDISRYLQLLPGVVASSDYSNQVLVRGGHPLENLFLVDGIEVPNINHLANANTTGGFGPMIDAAVIQGLDFHTGGYDAVYPERLSSVSEFRTLDPSPSTYHAEFDFGVQGIGGLIEKAMRGGDLLLSAHHGLVDVISKDMGIDGVPAYTNEFTRYRRNGESGNHFTLLNVAGWDSISIQPAAHDHAETSTINSEYEGWRETTGFDWQKIYSPRSFAVMDVSDSEQVEEIEQSDQLPDPTHASRPADVRGAAPVYLENSNNAFSTAKYRYEWAGEGFAVSTGTAVWLQRPHFDVAQPMGAFSPYSDVLTRADSTSFKRNFSIGETGTFAQVVAHPLQRLTLSGGGRLQTFAFGHHTTVTPRLSASYALGEKAHLHVAVGNYAQMPPYAYLLAYPVNGFLSPMRVRHQLVGLEFELIPASHVRLEAYNKVYRSIPASTEYAPLTLHTIVDMIGEQFVWLPMTSSGRGSASGIEASDTSHIGSHLQILGSVAYARAKFAGTDGVFRPSNFDFPWIANAAGVLRLRHLNASGRYAYASGRPYTPFNLLQTAAQNRPIYDLSQVNVLRAPCYSRLDLMVIKEMRIHRQHLETYAGVDNVLNRSNFLSYAWMPRMSGKPEDRVGTLWQTPIFPNFGVRLIAR